MNVRVILAVALGVVCATLAAGRHAPSPDMPPILVIDAAGKEQKLKSWKFTIGVRHLTWLAPAPPPKPAGDADKDQKPRPRGILPGPEALEFREDNSTTFVDGVLTIVPLDRLRALDYDLEQKTVTAKVATGPKAEDNEVLTGTTRFDRVNKLAIDAEVDKGDLGVADLRYIGGTARGIHGLRFPAAKPAGPPTGRSASLTTAGKEPATMKVNDLQALYRFASGHERVAPLLMFKKTLKLDVAKIQKITNASTEEESGTWQVQMKDGNEETLSLLRVITLDGQDAQLEGLLGKVPAGYKLFPVLTIGEVVFDPMEPKPEDKPAKE
jgi:hypothetical protein